MKVYLSTNVANNQIVAETGSKPAFQAKPNVNKLNEEVAKHMKKLPNALIYLGKNDGEIMNTLVTAGGTAIVAPIFIAGNPFSKETPETKWYSAMRQPISAIIAVAAQISVNKAYNNWIAKKASTGGFDRADLRAMPDKGYLKRIVKLEHPEFDKEQIKAEVETRQIIAEKRMLAKLRNEMKGKDVTIDSLVDIDALNDAKKQLGKEYRATHETEFVGMKERKVEKLLKKKIQPEEIRNRAIKNIENALEVESKAKFEIRELAKKYTNIDEAVEFISAKATNNDKEKEIQKSILDKLETMKLYEESENLKPFSSVKNLGKTYDEILHNVKVKKLLRVNTANAQKVFKTYKNELGILVSLATLPFSCGLLNWAYPRVMEKIMPSITKWIHRNDPKPIPQPIEQTVSDKTEVDDIDDLEDLMEELGGLDDD